MSALDGVDSQKKLPSRRARFLRAAVVVLVVLAGLGWLATWLVERSLRTPARKRAMQTWLDDTLNADVSLLGDMIVRINILRNSRLMFHNTEVEHPNPTFAGKLARIGRIGVWSPPLAVAGILPGLLDVRFRNLDLAFEQGDTGEWSHDGIMRPLASGDVSFPFPLPAISRWVAGLEESSISLSRGGGNLTLRLDGEVRGRTGSSRISSRLAENSFTFTHASSGRTASGTAGPANVALDVAGGPDVMPVPVAGRCDAAVENLPVSMVPFVVRGIPMEEVPGDFDGSIRYDEHPDAAGVLSLEGTLTDVPLAVFGLSRNAPLRLSWPIAPKRDGLEAAMHLGPEGYGAIDMSVKLDGAGAPSGLSIRGDVAALDNAPQFFTRYSRWPDWLSRAFTDVVWRTRNWHGFGWQGTNLELALSRTTAGLNLTGQGEMLGGGVRLAMTPEDLNTPITVVGEHLDPGQLSSRLSQLLPGAFRATVLGGGVNMTWRGFPTAEGTIDRWGLGLVWSKPVIDVSGSGTVWRTMASVTQAIADALPEWGGGDASRLLAMARSTSVALDQLAFVAERTTDGLVLVEFRAFGRTFGTATGLVRCLKNGVVEGEVLLAGASQLLETVFRESPDFARALDFLANDTPGLRVSIRMEPEGELTSRLPFLEEAKRIHREVTGASSAGAGL